MNYYGDVGFWGMHMFWWIFWFGIFAVGISLFEPVPRSRTGDHNASPLEILKKRYAKGDITDADYERMKNRLEFNGVKSIFTTSRKI